MQTPQCVSHYAWGGWCNVDGCNNYSRQATCEANASCDWQPVWGGGPLAGQRVQCGTCSCPGPLPPLPVSCTISLYPASASMEVGVSSPQPFVAAVTPVNSVVNRVDFSSSKTGVATVSPASDSTPAYETSATAVSPGTSTITATATLSDNKTNCSATSALTVTSPNAWWQVKDADVIAANSGANITSSIPSTATTPTFDLSGTGGYPGVPRYGGALALRKGVISSTKWNANSITDLRRKYDYNWFKARVPSDVSSTWTDMGAAQGCTPGPGPCLINGGGGYFNSGNAGPRGYNWFYYDGNKYGDLELSGPVNLTGTRKVVLLVEGADLDLKSQINVLDGNGFFMVIVGAGTKGAGDIRIDPGLYASIGPAIEAILYADGKIQTGTSGSGDNQLYIRGSVAAYGGVQLQRSMADNSKTPAELIEYAPDLMVLYPDVFKVKGTRWREVVP